MKKTIITALAFVLCIMSNAQGVYHRLEIGTNNIYTFAAANLLTAGLNALTDDMLFDNAYTYTYMHTGDNLEVKGRNVLGLTARDVFSDVTLGGKIGYQSTNPGNFNWGVFASAHYRINQFDLGVKNSDAFLTQDIHRAQFGGGLLFTLGDIESSTKVIIEAGVRYEIPVLYNAGGVKVEKVSNALNSGLSSHVAVRLNGSGSLQGIGIYADIPHYKLYKGSNIKPYTIGLLYTITPWKIKGY